ncbi:LacI family DNA-binding transcriptional regulator [Brevibacterium sp. NPDC049920]|uniref:LacI family DNA-binding transcriptional regulator n=1 Tax=Brevibacterium sp. NPDC049920 TaxID=3155279 RepID=UPI0033F380D4
MRTDVSLARIAEVSGRSESTVSRVLRRAPGVSAEARRAVEVALRTLGVSGAEAAPSDRGIIAVVQAVVLGADVDAFESLFLEMVRRIYRVGRVALRVTTGPELESSATRLQEFGIVGAVVLGGQSAGPEAKRLAALNIPVMRVSNARHEGTGQIVLDATQGIDTAVRHLVHLGHRRIGIAVPEDSAAASRVAAYRRSMADLLHIPATRDQAPVAQAGPGILAGSQAAERLLQANCSAVISCSPAITFGVLESARRAGLDVPRDLSLLTVGEMPDADAVHPPLSQVTFDWPQLAQTAIGELERLIAGSRTLPDYSVTPELVLRSSEMPVRTR